MNSNTSNDIQIVRQRTVAGCITEGWCLLADNIWNLLRLSWPMLIATSIWGIVFAIILRPGIYSFPALLAMTLLACIISLLWLWHTATLLRTYYMQGTLAATTTKAIYSQHGKPSAMSIIQHLGLIVRHPGQWPALFAILFVGTTCIAILTLLFAMPLYTVTLTFLQAGAAATIGDNITLPTYLTWLAPIMAAIATSIHYILSWMLTLPLAFFVGKLIADRQMARKDDFFEKK